MNRRQSLVFVFCCAIALATGSLAFAGGTNTTDPNLPPIPSTYLTPAQVHAMYHGPGLAVILSQVQHKPFALESRQPIGPDEKENFQSTVDGQISVNGSPNQPFNGSGPVMTLVHNKVGNTTGTFQTEMLSLDLSGGSPFGPFMIRESPTLASTGQTSITSLGGGLFHIDSFFDVFTELSVDGGQSWIPSDTSTHVELVPEPTSLALVGLSLLGLVSITRRRR